MSQKPVKTTILITANITDEQLAVLIYEIKETASNIGVNLDLHYKEEPQDKYL
jgi:hypothetical protein